MRCHAVNCKEEEMTEIAVRLYGYFKRHRVLFYSLLAVSVILMGFSLVNLRFDENITSFLPQDADSGNMAACVQIGGGRSRVQRQASLYNRGQPGEVTVTTLGVEAMPLLRFRTGDICRMYTEPCQCGRNSARLSSVIGRRSQMVKFKGTTLYPPALFDVLDNIPEITNYIVEVYTNDLGTDEVLVRVGCDDHSDAFSQLRESRVYREAPDASDVEKGSQVH